MTRWLYFLTALFGILGAVVYIWVAGIRPGMAFACGAACSAGNLWIFDRISQQLAPSDPPRKPLQAGAYFVRYVLLLGIGYGIVKALDVNPLAVILGLLSSTAAALTYSVYELIAHLFSFRSRTE